MGTVGGNYQSGAQLLVLMCDTDFKHSFLVEKGWGGAGAWSYLRLQNKNLFYHQYKHRKKQLLFNQDVWTNIKVTHAKV